MSAGSDMISPNHTDRVLKIKHLDILAVSYILTILFKICIFFRFNPFLIVAWWVILHKTLFNAVSVTTGYTLQSHLWHIGRVTTDLVCDCAMSGLHQTDKHNVYASISADIDWYMSCFWILCNSYSEWRMTDAKGPWN